MGALVHRLPVDRKWYRNAVIARIVRSTLEAFDLTYPSEMPGLERYGSNSCIGTVRGSRPCVSSIARHFGHGRAVLRGRLQRCLDDVLDPLGPDKA